MADTMQRDLTAKIFTKLDTLVTDVNTIKVSLAGIEAELKTKPTEVQVINEIDRRTAAAVKNHVAACKLPVMDRHSLNSGDSGTIKIKVKDLTPIIRYIIYFTVPLLASLLGYSATDFFK